jgi:hypothetical protein
MILFDNESSMFTRLTRILLTYFDTEDGNGDRFTYFDFAELATN